MNYGSGSRKAVRDFKLVSGTTLVYEEVSFGDAANMNALDTIQ